MGYDAPDNVPIAALIDEYTKDGKPLLRADIGGYEAAHTQASGGASGHTTVLAHSYGSYLTGLAVRDGMKVDDVVFLGSPGVGANNVTGLGMEGKHVYNGLTRDDPIRLSAGFGSSTGSQNFGATQIGVDDSHGHSEYYKPGSESLANLARIAAGNGSQITLPDPPPEPTFPPAGP